MPRLKSWGVEILWAGVVALLIYLTLEFTVQPVIVHGLSSYPTLQEGDYLVVEHIEYSLSHPARGDMVVVKDTLVDKNNLVKRIVGLPKENILIQNGQVFINDKLLAEPYLEGSWTRGTDWPNSGVSYQLQSNEYFVMGDNRDNSYDSRNFGPITLQEIQGHAWARVWPLAHLGLIPAGPYFKSSG